MKPKDLKHSEFSKHHLKNYANRAPDFSGRFLRWFLENILRLDEFDADDAAVDAKHDKGVDAIYVDDVGARVLHGEKPRPGRLIYVAPDRTLQSVAEGLACANGVVISPDGARPYLAETMISAIKVYDF